MLSPPDIAVIGVFALLIFGPDQLPKVARRAGQIMRDVQNTSQTFIREMERAADDMDLKEAFAADAHTMSGPRPASEKISEMSPSLAEQEAARPTHQTAADAAKTEGPLERENGVSKDAVHEESSGI